jgi:hypothetical protein
MYIFLTWINKYKRMNKQFVSSLRPIPANFGVWAKPELQFFSSLRPFLANFGVWAKSEVQSVVKDRKPVSYQKGKGTKDRNQYIGFMIIQLAVHDTHICTSEVKHHNRTD